MLRRVSWNVSYISMLSNNHFFLIRKRLIFLQSWIYHHSSSSRDKNNHLYTRKPNPFVMLHETMPWSPQPNIYGKMLDLHDHHQKWKVPHCLEKMVVVMLLISSFSNGSFPTLFLHLTFIVTIIIFYIFSCPRPSLELISRLVPWLVSSIEFIVDASAMILYDNNLKLWLYSSFLLFLILHWIYYLFLCPMSEYHVVTSYSMKL